MRVVALAVLLAAAACGHKTPPIAPQLVRPDPPGALAAISTPEGVRLTWLRPQKYSGGQRMNDLGGFTIERATAEGGEFMEVGKLELDDQTRFRRERHLDWADRTALPGYRYRYRVIAFTLDDYHSAPAGPVTVQFGEKPTP
jgi:hypothetical protein